MDLRRLDGRGYARFLAAGSYFLKKYRTVLNDLNVYPVPDGDTGTNMLVTLRSAALAAYATRDARLAVVAAAAAHGGLMGARGNSGVILSQMLRGFAHHVRHRDDAGAFVVATAMREAASAARQAIEKPVEGTIVSVADAAADAAYRLALHEPDLIRLLSGVIRFANDALEKTPEQLPALRDAGVVDAGGAGLVYLLEGTLAFVPEVRVRATAFPRRPVRAEVFSPRQQVGVRRYCTELILEDAACGVAELRRALEPRGDSLLVVGAQPTLKVHVHTDEPERVRAIAERFGTATRFKVDDMAHQHTMLLVESPKPARSVVAVVAGPGFETIAKELGADVTLSAAGRPSVAELLLALNNALGDTVYLLANDGDVVPAALEAARLCAKQVHVVATRTPVEGVSGLLALRGTQAGVDAGAIERAARRTRSARLFLAAKDARLGGVAIQAGRPAALYGDRWFTGATIAQVAVEAVTAMAAGAGGLVTLYYGGSQREKDAARLTEEVCASHAGIEVEYYYGGMKNAEYWIGFDD